MEIKTVKDAQKFFEAVKELDYSYEYSNGQNVAANLFRNDEGVLIATVWEGSSGYLQGPATAELIWQDSKAINKALREIEARSAVSQAASALGKLGGAAKTEAKASASRANGKLGGRPKKAIAQAEEIIKD